jgi:hypothetical protein
MLIPLKPAAQIYIWTDKDGVKHVTNTAPPPEAENIQEQGEAIHTPQKPETIKDKLEKATERYKDSMKEIETNRQTRRIEAEKAKAAADYQVSSISVTKEGEDRIKVSGRVSGGGACKVLQVFISLSGDKGGFTNIITSVDNVGGSASRIFEGTDWVGSTYAVGTWKVVGTSFRCISN